MINKKNLWFLTLFSLVLVLSIYYVTMPSEIFLTNNSLPESVEEDKQVNTEIEESDVISALRVEDDATVLEEMNALKQTLTDLNVSVEDKNLAFENLKNLNLLKGKEDSLEDKIKKNYQVEAFVKIEDDQIRVVVGSKDHSVTLANNIMRSVQEEFENKMYISVKFQG